jgi:ssDNA-binding replication factor A large subunit
LTQDNINQLIDKIIATNKISKEDLQQKIREKMESLGSLISEEGAAHIIANELGIPLNISPSIETTLDKLHATMKNVSILVKVLRKYDVRTFGEGGKVGSLFVGDEKGFSRLTFWNDKTTYLDGIQEQDVLLIQNAYTKENNGRIEIHMGNSSHCIVNPKGRTVTVKEKQEPQAEAKEKKLNDITDQDTFVTITATIVQVYDPRFFESCPVCNKRMREESGVFACAEHGNQSPAYNYVMNLFLDDGSNNMRATLWKEQICQLLGKSEDEILIMKDNSALLEEIKMDLLGKIIRARARVRVNETYNNKELVLYKIDVDPNPENSEIKQAETKPVAPVVKPTSSPAPEESKSVKAEKVDTSTVSEELFDEDDEELLSIDDLEEEI